MYGTIKALVLHRPPPNYVDQKVVEVACSRKSEDVSNTHPRLHNRSLISSTFFVHEEEMIANVLHLQMLIGVVCKQSLHRLKGV